MQSEVHLQLQFIMRFLFSCVNLELRIRKLLYVDEHMQFAVSVCSFSLQFQFAV